MSGMVSLATQGRNRLSMMIGTSVVVALLQALGCSRRTHGGAPDPDWIQCIRDEDCPLPIMWKAFALCGTVTANTPLTGRYEVDADRSFQGPLYYQPDADAHKREMAACFLKRQTDRYSDFVIERDRIRSGKERVQEFCFLHVSVETDSVLDAIAVWHEDVDDPGDASLTRVRVERDGQEVRFHIYGEEKDLKGRPVFLRAVR
jgi:hypothetical protein